MTNGNWVEVFEDYYFGRLDDGTIAVFESALTGNPDLKEKYLAFVSVIQSGELNNIKEELLSKKEVRDFFADNFKRRKPWYRRFPFLLGIILIAGVFLFLVYYLQSHQDFPDEKIELLEGDDGQGLPEYEVETSGEENKEFLNEGNEEEFFEPVEEVEDGEILKRVAIVNDYIKRSYAGEIITRGSSIVEGIDEKSAHECLPLLLESQFKAVLVCLDDRQDESDVTEILWLKSLAHFGLGEREKAIELLEVIKRDRLSKFLPYTNQLLEILMNE